jgi:hypothetical protein
MKKIDKKINIEIIGERQSGYVVKLPPVQTPNDFHITFDEWYAFYKLSHAYFKSIKMGLK